MENIASSPVDVKPRKPWLAGLLSLWTPGLGQLYSGHWKRAVAIWIGGLALLSGLAFAGLPRTFPGLVTWICIALLFYVWVLWDAVRLARNTPGYRLKPFNRWYLYILLGLAAGFAAKPLVAALPVKSFRIPSGTMEPTLRPGDHLMADRTFWRRHTPSRGDLVIFAHPEQPDLFAAKRVVAVAGDTLEIRNKTVLVNGQPLADDRGVHTDPNVFPPGSGFGPAGFRDNFGPLTIPEGTVFVLGDNRDNSYDSRFFGPLPMDLLRARPLFLYWATDKSRIGARLE